MKIYRDALQKNVLILVVTVAEWGVVPNGFYIQNHGNNLSNIDH